MEMESQEEKLLVNREDLDSWRKNLKRNMDRIEKAMGYMEKLEVDKNSGYGLMLNTILRLVYANTSAAELNIERVILMDDFTKKKGI